MNYQLLHAVNNVSGHWGTLDNVMVFCATYLIYAVVAGLLVAAAPFLRARQWYTLVCAVAALAGTFALGLLLSAVLPEPRPFTTHPGVRVLTPHDPGQSFPSDHATAAFAIAFVLLAYADRRWGRARVRRGCRHWRRSGVHRRPLPRGHCWSCRAGRRRGRRRRADDRSSAPACGPTGRGWPRSRVRTLSLRLVPAEVDGRPRRARPGGRRRGDRRRRGAVRARTGAPVPGTGV